jgi:hypothetical protein
VATQYYAESADPRVPPLIKLAADELWHRAWVPSSKSFWYESIGDTTVGAPDLNLLIAPLYAWIYMMTGDTIYQQR